MRIFLYIKATQEQKEARRKAGRRVHRQVVHTAISFASAGVYLCGCGMKIEKRKIKDFLFAGGRVTNSSDFERVGGVNRLDRMFYWEWCPGCREDYMTEVTAVIFSAFAIDE